MSYDTNKSEAALIKFVFLDLDDTIFDFHKSEGSALSYTLSGLGIEPTAQTLALYSKINREGWEMLERGEATRAEILTRRFRILFEKLGKDIPATAAQALYEKRLSEEYCYVDGAPELINSLLGKYKLYLASNGTARVQDGRIAISGIAKFFDGIFISERIGHDKPSREFFEGCFKLIPDFSREEAIIIGDSLSSDILGGKNANIRTCLFNPQAKPLKADILPDYEIRELSEIPALLEKI